jgi:hypothetical protein
MAFLNSQQAPVRPVQHRQQPRQHRLVALISNLLPLCHQATKKGLEEKQPLITVLEIRLLGESSLLFENCQESSAKESLDK